jgi:hypothetical protein
MHFNFNLFLRLYHQHSKSLLSWPKTSINIKTPSIKDDHWIKPFVTYLCSYDIILDKFDELIQAILFYSLDLLVKPFQETCLEVPLKL